MTPISPERRQAQLKAIANGNHPDNTRETEEVLQDFGYYYRTGPYYRKWLNERLKNAHLPPEKLAP